VSEESNLAKTGIIGEKRSTMYVQQPVSRVLGEELERRLKINSGSENFGSPGEGSGSAFRNVMG
jgi:hypothetical protein